MDRHNLCKYCLYHHDHSHDIEEWIQLQDKIEGLIRRGRLDRFLQDQSEKHDAPGASSHLPKPPLRSKEPINHLTSGKVNTIINKSAEGGLVKGIRQKKLAPSPGPMLKV